VGFILVVDDDEDTRDTLNDVLANEGFDVRLAGRADEALDVILGLQRPSLVLLDCRLQGTSGIELLDFLQTRPDLDSVAVVMVSGDSASVPHPRAVALLRKPYDLDTLLHFANQYCKVEPR